MPKTIDYINLSKLVYAKFRGDDRGKSIGSIFDKAMRDDNQGKREGLDTSSLELSALKEESNPLRSWILLDFISTPSGFRAAAFQSPSSNVNIDLSSCNELIIKRVLFA